MFGVKLATGRDGRKVHKGVTGKNGETGPSILPKTWGRILVFGVKKDIREEGRGGQERAVKGGRT